MWSARCGNCSTSVLPSGGTVVRYESCQWQRQVVLHHGGETGPIKIYLGKINQPEINVSIISHRHFFGLKWSAVILIWSSVVPGSPR